MRNISDHLSKKAQLAGALRFPDYGLFEVRLSFLLSPFCFLLSAFALSTVTEDCQLLFWRRERDSNPRLAFAGNGFQDRRFKPLTHPSASLIQTH